MKILNIHNKKKTIYLFSRDEKGNQIIRKDNDFFPFYYEPHSEGNFRGYDGVPLKKIFVSEPSDVPKLRSEKSYSADIIYTNNYMINKVDTIEPCILKYIFIDIEVLAKEFPEPSKAKYPVSCITIYNSMTKEYKTWSLFETKEEVLLNNCLDYIKKEAPDLILAWNVDFDYIYIYNRCSKFKINFPKFISPINQVRLGGVKDIFYPAGISIVDYSGNKMKAGLFSKVYMREPTYALDYIGEKYLKRGKKYKNPYFGSINKEVILRNIDDVKMMVELEEKFKLIPYYDELRRLAKVKWEDLAYNSRIVEMMLLEEAKNRNIVLPNKKDNVKKEKFKGATRDFSELGAVFDVGKFDLTSAYPSMIVNFCLDSQNITESKKGIDINGTKFLQNKETLLPAVVKKILTIKDELKKALKKDSGLLTKYNAIKAVVNSTFGVMGNKYFRLYDNRIASAITFLVRDLIIYTRKRLEEKGYKVLYWDTDSVFLNTKDDISDILNQYIQDWGKTYGKDNIELLYEYEGYFTKLFLLAKCHYYGYVYGKTKPEIKGVEIKRNNSSKYEAYFQQELLEKILNKEPKRDIIKWINEEKIKIKTVPLTDIIFPTKVKNIEYAKRPIFVRAYENSKKLFKEEFDVSYNELFWYVYTKSYGIDSYKKEINVIGINKNMDIDKNKINWDEMIRRSIINKVENIFNALKWSTLEIHYSNQTTLF